MLAFHCLISFVSAYLYKHGWILGEANERRSARVPLFAEMPRAPLESFALSFCIVY